MNSINDRLYSETLSNGLQVYILQDPSTSLFSAKTFVRAGSVHESPFLGCGLSHFLEHLVAGGPTHAATEAHYQALIAKLGGSYNAYTTLDHTCYYLNTVNDYAEDAIQTLYEWMFLNDFSEKEFLREQAVITREIERDQASVSRQFYKKTQDAFYTTHPMKYPVIGYLDNFKTVTLQDLKTYYHSRYVASNMALIIGGNCDPHHLMTQIRATFGQAPRIAPPPQLYTEEPLPVMQRDNYHTGDITTTYFGVRFPSAPLHSSDLFPLDILDYILGNGEGSILHKIVVQEKKLAYSISCHSATPTIGGGYFEITAKTDARHLSALKKTISKIIKDLQAHPVSQRHVLQAKKQKIAEDVLDIETIEDKVDRIGQGFIYAKNPDFPTYYLEKIHHVTALDIQRVAQQYLSLDRALWTSLSPKPTPLKTTKPLQNNTSALRLPEKVTLPNGIRILLYPDTSRPALECKLISLGGLYREDLSKNGLGYLTSRIWGKVTENYSKKRILDLVDGNGAYLNAGFGHHTHSISLECLSTDFSKLWPVYVETCLRPKFKQEDLEEERRKQLQRIHQRSDDWQVYCGYHLRKTFFGTHPYARSVIGEKKLVSTFTLSDLEAYFATAWDPKEMVFTVFGNFSPARVLQDITNAFGPLSSPPPASILHPSLSTTPHLTPTEHHRKIKQSLAACYVGFDGLSFTQQALRPGIDLLHAVLAGIHYPSGRLHTGLRERGLVYMVHAQHFVGIDPGNFLICALTSSPQKAEVMTYIHSQIDDLKTTVISKEEFSLALSQLRYHLKERISSWEQLAHHCGLDELFGLGFDALIQYEKDLNALTPQEVKRLANQFLINPQNYIFEGNDHA